MTEVNALSDGQYLVIRNASESPIALTRAQRRQSRAIPTSTFFSNWLSPTKSDIKSTSTLITSSNSTGSDKISLSQETPGTCIKPFHTLQTTIIAPASNTSHGRVDDTLHLIFTIAGHKYSLQVPTVEDRSTALQPFDPAGKHEITAIYLPSAAFLILFSTTTQTRWMSLLPDSIPLTRLSMPGTHNSPAHFRAMPCVRCQAVSIRKQLDNGIRFMDIRLQPASATNLDDETLYLVHGAFRVSLTGNYTFRGLLDRVYAFLDENPSEAILVSLKREGIGKATDDHLAQIIWKHYISVAPNKWYVKARLPILGEARGRLILLRRFNCSQKFAYSADREWGIDATFWEDNTPCSLNSTGQLCIQDFYQVLESVNIDTKIKYVQDHLVRAATEIHNDKDISIHQPLYINFLSASNFWRLDCWPERIAQRLNPTIVEYICQRHCRTSDIGNDYCTGVVISDWAGNAGDWDLVRLIVAMNGSNLLGTLAS